MNKTALAKKLIREFKGSSYEFGLGCFDKTGMLAARLGRKVLIVANNPHSHWKQPLIGRCVENLKRSGLEPFPEVLAGAGPNTPREDVFRMAEEISRKAPDLVLSMGSGSSIDATKAAIAYSRFGEQYPDLNDYFGNDQVSKMETETGKKMIPVLAVQLAASSAAHLTKYANITDISTGQKMLIVDNAVIPPAALFDYANTLSQPKDLTLDGGLDGVSHSLEVLMGIPDEKYEQVKQVALTGISLIIGNLKKACLQPENPEAREGLGLGTDLGGNAIMIGGTNGAHLNSFSMTDILSHGRACALMNPYYIVFFAASIEKRLRDIAEIYVREGYMSASHLDRKGRELGISLASAMIKMGQEIGFPVTLKEIPGFTDEHIRRCLAAAKNPKLESKLKNMPVPLQAGQIDEYMGGILEAASTGNFSFIKNLT